MEAEVLIGYGAKIIDKAFSYDVPKNLEDKLKIGMKVVVPFGKTTTNGFVINIKTKTNENELKSITNIADETFVLNDELLKLGKYIKETTLCSLVTSYQCMLPSSMKIKNIKSNYQKYDEYLILNSRDLAKDFIKNNARKKRALTLLNDLLNANKVLKKNYSSAIVEPLLNENIIKIVKENKYRINKTNNKESAKKLTTEQLNVYESITSSLNTNDIFLLLGVTGSGKTEVYMQVIEKVIAEKKNVIMLVPEISLSMQIVNRFYERFGSSVAIFHSALSEGEKYDEYHKILNGDVHLVVGTRSAIFAPFPNIGLIILDEEQSSNYKQDNNPRYHAKDIAIWRSQYHHCPVILGSATPSLESMARASKGVYKLLTLKNRIGNAKLPKVTLVDMQVEYKKRNMIVSDKLDSLIKERINNHEQVIIFLNRRGFTTMKTCKNCGFTFKCPHCDITLIYHKSSNHLRCHYCGYTLLNTDICPECHENSLTSYGLGTEKLEEELKIRYKDANILRMDADTTSKKGSSEAMIKQIENGDIDIIIGTQMISKGFDFPKVTLVGIINADETLNIPDFRSGERTFELISQTAGRAGRKDLPGEVIIQTFNPENNTLLYVANNDYLGMYNYEMNIRKTLKYPPYFYLTIIKIASKDYNMASSEISKVYSFLNKNLNNVIMLGPTTASMFKVNGIYRFQIILKYKNYEFIKNTLISLDDLYKTNTKVNLEIDNNPSRL